MRDFDPTRSAASITNAPMASATAAMAGVRSVDVIASANMSPMTTTGIVPITTCRTKRADSFGAELIAPVADATMAPRSRLKYTRTAPRVPTWQATSNASPNSPASPAKDGPSQYQVSRTGNRKEFGQSLDDSEQRGLERGQCLDWGNLTVGPPRPPPALPPDPSAHSLGGPFAPHRSLAAGPELGASRVRGLRGAGFAPRPFRTWRPRRPRSLICSLSPCPGRGLLDAAGREACRLRRAARRSVITMATDAAMKMVE